MWVWDELVKSIILNLDPIFSLFFLFSLYISLLFPLPNFTSLPRIWHSSDIAQTLQISPQENQTIQTSQKRNDASRSTFCRTTWSPTASLSGAGSTSSGTRWTRPSEVKYCFQVWRIWFFKWIWIRFQTDSGSGTGLKNVKCEKVQWAQNKGRGQDDIAVLRFACLG